MRSRYRIHEPDAAHFITSTIIAPDAMTADALSTAVSVLGPERGLRLVEETPGTAAHLVRQPGAEIELRESTRWRDVPRAPAAP